MRVLKRNGSYEPIMFDKITKRINDLCKGICVHPEKVTQKVVASIIDGIETSKIDEISAEIAVHMITEHPDYEILATRILVSNLQKQSPKCFSDAAILNHSTGLLSLEFMKNINLLYDSTIIHDRDYDFGYFGIKTLISGGYLLPNETPQYMYMRVAIEIHKNDVKKVIETYNYLSLHYFTHASPTLFNAGSNNPQLASCFLVASKGDSITGIYDTIKECAEISKWSGGIGVHIHDIRAKGSRIKGTNGTSDGIIPMLRVYNATARYVNQGGKRKGSIAVYLEPWHADILDFLTLRLNHGDEESRCRDLFTALWIPDHFMQCVKDDAYWHLMCPNESPGLSDVWGLDWTVLYEHYISTGKYKKKVKAREIWNAIIKSQIETGTPYMLYKDRVNMLSNQRNLGTIKSSNLCGEIIQYSDSKETAVCNLASISLPKMVENGVFNFNKLVSVTQCIVRNLNRVIDSTYYPTKCSKISNIKHRPIAIGVQGLADVFMMLNLPFDSDYAKELNRDIFHMMYVAALGESCKESALYGPYESFVGSPASKGQFHPDLWGVDDKIPETLREKVKFYGLRNSLLIAPMPTASTSQILGNNECFEPYTSNMYVRRTLAGEFVIINKHLVKNLIQIGMWDNSVKEKIIRDNGSVQNLVIPDSLKRIYRTVWEIPQKSIIDMAADRAPYIDQTQSMNLFLEEPTVSKISSMHMYGWEKGLKTGMYYLRTRPSSKPIQVTLSCTKESCTSCSG
jgi:ribonucleoside-diphosphate reductase alpha chain/ribonucleoside-diphosphate reductase subunit M1